MSDYLTEDQQIAQIKQWLEQHGRRIANVLLAIVLVIGAIQGWRYYQRETAQQASVLYQQMTKLLTVKDDAANQKLAEQIANELKSSYSHTTYAQFAALFLAKFAVEEKQYDVALEQLNWVLDQNPEKPVRFITQLRVARLLLAKGDLEKALERVSIDDAEGFTASYEEMKGDIYLKMGKTDEARAAYQAALEAAQKEDSMDYRVLLEIKASDLAVAKENKP